MFDLNNKVNKYLVNIIQSFLLPEKTYSLNIVILNTKIHWIKFDLDTYGKRLVKIIHNKDGFWEYSRKY